MTLARSYQALGRLDDARAHAEAARRLLESSGDLRERLEARAVLASIALDQGRIEGTRAAIDTLVADQRRAFGAADPATLASTELLGRALAAEGQYDVADSTLRAATALVGDDAAHWRLHVDLDRALASVWMSQGSAREAESLLARTLVLERRHLGPDHPLIAATLRQRASALQKDLRPVESVAVLHEVIAVSTRVNGAEHPATGEAWMSLAVSLDNQRRHAEALDATQHAVAIFRATLGNEHPLTLKALRNLAILLHGQQRYAAADSVYTEVWKTCARTLGPDHAQTLEALQGLVYLRLDEGRTAEATAYARQIGAAYARVASRPDADPVALTTYAEYLVEAQPPEVRDPRRAVEVARRAVDASHHQDYSALRALGFAEAAAGDPRAAIAALNQALALPEGVRSWTTEDKLVELLQHSGVPSELERTLLARLDLLRRVRGPDDRYLAKTERHLAHAYRDAGHDSLAEHWARETLAQLRKSLPETHWEIGRAKAELGSLHVAAGNFTEAESLLVQGARTLEADPEVPQADLESARADLVKLYRATGRPGVARAWHDHVFAARAPSTN
jgi:tetratricopeptide (TPR) repeat protein